MSRSLRQLEAANGPKKMDWATAFAAAADTDHLPLRRSVYILPGAQARVFNGRSLARAMYAG
jgi:hypothetical protein